MLQGQCFPALWVVQDTLVLWLEWGRRMPMWAMKLNLKEAHVFRSKAGACALFLSNYDPNWSIKVNFWNKQYDSPPWSFTILPDYKNVAYNTAKVYATSTQVQMTLVGGQLQWQSSNDFNRQNPFLTVMSSGHALHVFINGQLAGTVCSNLDNPKLTCTGKVMLTIIVNRISLLRDAVGLLNVGLHFEIWNAGVFGPVTLSGLKGGTQDLTKQNGLTRYGFFCVVIRS